MIDHGHRTRSSTGTKPTLAPFHTAAEGYSALVTSVLKFGVPVGPSVQATALITPSEEPVNLPNYSDEHAPNATSAYAMSTFNVNDALREYKDSALEALLGELRQMLKFPAFEAVDVSSLTWEQLKKRIPSKMFFVKLKYLANGDFEKVKARLVAGGHRQDRSGYTEEQTSSSPTAGTMSLFTVAGLAARERHKVRSCDIGAAYLKAKILEEVFMYLDPKMSALLCIMKLEWTPLLDTKGRLTVRLLRALYGCIESGKLWHDALSEFLESIGYVRNPHDICVFNKWHKDIQKQSTAIVHVDDLMITCESDGPLDWIMAELRGRFGDLTEHKGQVHSYLGMQFDFADDGKVKITMPGYIEKILTKYGIEKVQKYPTDGDLFKKDENSPLLNDALRIDFHSRVYKAAYMA